jgi:hypothetical protein
MDDMKLAGGSEEELRNEIRIVKTTGNDTEVESGLDRYMCHLEHTAKCKT